MTEPHVCRTPPTDQAEVGEKWDCDCGKTWTRTMIRVDMGDDLLPGWICWTRQS